MATPAAHGTPDAPLLLVRGETTLETDPEIARLGITVTARGRDRRTTLDDLTRRNTEVLDLIRSYGDAVTEVSTGAVTAAPQDAPPEPLDLEPERIRVRAEVRAQFTMLPPHL